MARTKKVGITGRFGARYGRKAKRSVKIIEENMKKIMFALNVLDLMLKDKLLEFGNAENVAQYLLEELTFHKLLWQNLQHVILGILKWRNKLCIGVQVVEQK